MTVADDDTAVAIDERTACPPDVALEARLRHDEAEKLAREKTARDRLVRAIDLCVLGNNGLAHRLGGDRPPHTATVAEGLRRYGEPGISFDVWQSWRAVEHLREAADAWEMLSAELIKPTRKGTSA